MQIPPHAHHNLAFPIPIYAGLFRLIACIFVCHSSHVHMHFFTHYLTGELHANFEGCLCFGLVLFQKVQIRQILPSRSTPTGGCSGLEISLLSVLLDASSNENKKVLARCSYTVNEDSLDHAPFYSCPFGFVCLLFFLCRFCASKLK